MLPGWMSELALARWRWPAMRRQEYVSVEALASTETRSCAAAIKGEVCEIHYQPIIDLEAGRLAGFEAKVHIRSLDASFASPHECSSPAEGSSIMPAGPWLLVEACRQMRRWQERFPERRRLRIGFSLANRQFVCHDLARQVEGALRITGLAPEDLTLEVTEPLLLQHGEKSMAALTALHNRDIRLLLGDFGSGHSTLSNLRRFPLHSVKIDAVFVRRLEIDLQDARLVEAAVGLAKSFDMDVVADGIDTPGQLARLRELRVEYGQGNHFSGPLDMAGAEALVEAWPMW